MNNLSNLIASAFMVSLASPAFADDGSGNGYVPQLNPRGEALLAIETDRDGVIVELSAGVSEKDRPDYLVELDQLENHELIDVMVGTEYASMSFGDPTDYTNMAYTALSAPCRVLDTRKYNPGLNTSRPIEAGVAREVFDWAIGGQGGDATCGDAIPDSKQGLVVALSAVSPNFPDKFPSLGYGTLLNGAEMASGWTKIANVPGVTNSYWQYNYNTPPFNKAATIVWDTDTRLITTLAVVSRQTTTPDIVLYSAGTAHYTIDVVGYFSKPDLCAANTTFIDGLCWGPEQAAADWFDASQDCANEGGRLPSASAINGACRMGDLPNITLWADGWFNDGSAYRGQVSSCALDIVTTTTLTAYRCTFTPLTAP